MNTQTARVLDNATLTTLGHTATMLSFERFCAALGLENDAYARDKYRDLRDLARALSRFTNSSLEHLAQAYVASTTK